jgi:hypothetical protein
MVVIFRINGRVLSSIHGLLFKIERMFCKGSINPFPPAAACCCTRFCAGCSGGSVFMLLAIPMHHLVLTSFSIFKSEGGIRLYVRNVAQNMQQEMLKNGTSRVYVSSSTPGYTLIKERFRDTRRSHRWNSRRTTALSSLILQLSIWFRAPLLPFSQT